MMRWLFWLLLPLLGFWGNTPGASKPVAATKDTLPTTVRVTREADAATLTPATRQYAVHVRVVGEKLTFSLPETVARDGERVTVADVSTTAKTVAYKAEGGKKLPIQREVTEGTTAQFTIVGIDEMHAVLDFTFSFQGSPAGVVADQKEKQSLNNSVRYIDKMKLGETAVVTNDLLKAKFEVVVKAVESSK